jgi:AraC-like DNA-binding protein
VEPRTPAALTAMSVFAFSTLRISVCLVDEQGWHAVHVIDGVTNFELEHGRESERRDYNDRCLAKVRRDGLTVLAEHAGYHDLFVPVRSGGRVGAVLAAGPFTTARPTSGDLLARWHWLSGRQGHPSDPEFSHYVDVAMSTPVLEKQNVARLREYLECLAALMEQDGDAESIAARARSLLKDLEVATHVEHMWYATAAMVDVRTARSWRSGHHGTWLASLGVKRLPEHAVVGLMVGRADADPVVDLVARKSFQRSCCDLARRSGDVLAGRLGDHGIVFLAAASGSRLVRLASSARALASGELALRLHVGIGLGATLPEQFEAALEAAETALSLGDAVVHADARTRREGSSLAELRESLSGTAREQPAALAAHFERYLEVVALRCGHVLEPMRAHLEVAFEQMCQSLIGVGALDARSLAEMRRALERAARDASTVAALFGEYRRIVADIADAVVRPAEADRSRALRRAMRFLHERFGEKSATLGNVARIAGVASSHFSLRFREREGITFAKYRQRLRIERAKQLLATTRFPVDRVAVLSGFPEPHYFYRAFRQSVGTTPARFRGG